MVQLTVITVGTLKEGYLREALAEYKKRLSGMAKVTEVELREERIVNEDNSAEVASALCKEGERMLGAIPEGAYTVALCVEGREMDSEGLARALGEAASRTGKLAFLIGSSHGLSPEVKKRADLSLSVGRLTFPHQLMRVILYEVLYRSFSILAGKRYHK